MVSLATALAARCVCCGSSELSAGRGPLVVCRACGHGDASASVSSGEVVNERAALDAGRGPTLVERDQLRILRGARRGSGQLIDVGCSNGGFLRHALRSGLASDASYGVEVSEPNAAIARTSGLIVSDAVGGVEHGSVVTFWHSAEHLPVDILIEILTTVREKSSGLATAIIAVPNGVSKQCRWFGGRWCFADDEAHLSQFTAASLAHVLAAAGWTPDRWVRSPVYGAFGAVQSSLNLVMPRNQLYRALKRGEHRLRARDVVATAVAALAVAPVAVAAVLPEFDPVRSSVLTTIAHPR